MNISKNKLILVLAIFFATALVFGYVTYKRYGKLAENREERAAAAELIVWTYSSFMDSYGPAAELKKEFEKTCLCTIKYVDAGGSPMAIEKLRLDPKRRVDVLLGIDLLQMAKLMKSVRVQDLDRPSIDWDPQIIKYVYPRAVPYSWSPMGLIYRKNESQPVDSWTEALQKLPAKSIAVQDPTLSAPGLSFLFWISSLNPFEKFKDQLLSVNTMIQSYSPSWSAAYGLFKAKQTKMAFSYLTSLVYHWQHDKDYNFQFMSFKEGHPIQVEYAAVPDACWNCNVAKNFVSFLTTPFAQKILAEKNFMLPVNYKVREELNESFKNLPQVKLVDIQQLNPFLENEENILRIWQENH